MKTYFFYTLNKQRTPTDKNMEEIHKTERELLKKASETKDKQLQSWYMHGVAMSHGLKNDRMLRSEQYQFQNGQDARYFVRYGVKEIHEKDFLEIEADEERIVKSFNEKTLKLMDDFGHRKDGWHFPFSIDAESKSHLKWKLKQMFPDFEEFIFKQT